MTVHGEREIIPSVSRAEAPKVLERFTEGYNEAYRKLDPAAVERVETGALAEIGKADLAAQRAATPDGNPGYPALTLADARFTIPRMAGWPKFFVADARSNRDKNRWFVVFTRAAAKEPWKAAYLSILSDHEIPKFATDKDGWAEPVPATGGPDGTSGAATGLRMDPTAVSTAYTDYLRTGRGQVFAPGKATSALREDRGKRVRTPNYWTEFIDTPERAPAFPSFALRTDDGGALVFFTAHHREKRTMAKGLRPTLTERRTKALLSGDLKSAVTFVRVSESAVKVPAKSADRRVVFLNRIESLTAAKGE